MFVCHVPTMPAVMSPSTADRRAVAAWSFCRTSDCADPWARAHLPNVRASRYRSVMPPDQPARRGGDTRPRVIVSVTATADGRVTLSRADRLLDEGPNLRWQSAWPPDVAALLARRAAAIEQHHRPTVFLEGSGTFVADTAGPLQLPDTSEPAAGLRTDYLPCRSPQWFTVVDGRGLVAWKHKGNAETRLLVITSLAAPLTYLAYLRSEQIPYLLAGAHRVDIGAGQNPHGPWRATRGIAGRRRALYQVLSTHSGSLRPAPGSTIALLAGAATWIP